MTEDKKPLIVNCAKCGDQIGDKQPKNAVFLCDMIDDCWCGYCFSDSICAKEHAEGCATFVVCEAEPALDK